MERLTIIAMMLAAGCSSNTTICPRPIELSSEERAVMKHYIPKFYVEFTNQQIDLRNCR